MADLNLVNDFFVNLPHGNFDLSTSGTLRFGLSATAPGSESPDPTTDGNGTLDNVTQITMSNFTPSPPALTIATSAQASGVFTMTITDVTVTSTSDSADAFQYIYIYDYVDGVDDYLIGYFDYGSSLELDTGETLDIDFTGNFLQIAAA